MIRRAILSVAVLLSLAACTSMRESQPGRTATEQLLFSVAAERAAEQLALNIPDDTKVFVDAAYVEGTDSKYLLSTIRDRVLRRGGALVDDKANAELVIEPRLGAISVDRKVMRVGTPDFEIPIPMTGGFPFPEITLFKRDRQQGVIKIALTSYDPKTGALVQSLDPVYGFSHRTQWGAMLFFFWTTNDLMPDGEGEDWVDS